MRKLYTLLTSSALLLACSLAPTAEAPTSWLDRPLTNWNVAGKPVPAAPAFDEAMASVVSRCKVTPLKAAPSVQALTSAGWIAYPHFDQALAKDDVEVVGGMRGADGMCRPFAYNLFVFVGGRFAGVLSPAAMDSRLDGSAGIVRMRLPEITAEFQRYTSTDPLCCPSSRMTVRYRIDRTPAGPVVVPLSVATTRG